MAVIGVRAAYMQDARRRVERRLARVGLRVADGHLDMCADYLVLLDKWNQRMNLTALEDPDSAVDRLIVEPTMAAEVIDAGARVLVDVGSGGGSPAIPLKIARPDLALTMIEVKTRKSVFLREVVRHLGLSACNVETSRFEAVLGRVDLRGTVDVVSIRAVRAEAEQLRLFGDALRPGGQQLWFLSGAQGVPSVPSPLAVERDVPLVESLRSHVVVVRKKG
jgi:16S rRNA (guanine527-N7)-methyltransferase